MLVNVRSDAEFQDYLDVEEQRLFERLRPILNAAINIQITTNAARAQDYIVERGGRVLVREYEKIFSDQYMAVTYQIAATIGQQKAETVGDFLREQIGFITREGARRITRIAETLTSEIQSLVLSAVQAGKRNTDIAREIRSRSSGISKERAATIARTETHNSALDAIDKTLRFKKINVRKKRWWAAQDSRVRPSHSEVHDTVIDYDEPFDVGDSQMMRPGDQSLGAGPEEVVNCRCALLFETGPIEEEPPGPRSSAADLYEPAEKTADDLVEQFGAGAAIDDIRRRLKATPETHKPVSEGGFTLADGSYTLERQAFHRKIVNELISLDVIRAATPEFGRPTLTVLGGRGGSGKSWLTNKEKGGPVDKARVVVLDADEVKAKMKALGYAGWNAGTFHEESSHVLEMAVDRARQLGLNTVLDATLKSTKDVTKRVAAFEAGGYHVEGYYMYLGPEAATQRAMSRFKTKKGDFSGRFVPPEIILGNTQNEKNFDMLSPKFRRWGVYENTGTAPRLVQKHGY